jgi:putative ABC transport system ATP-binding protein
MPSDAEPAVRLQGVTKTFGLGETRTLALRGVDLDVRPGEITFLVGPSGCGKTTVITAVAGMLTPDDGQITVFGHDIRRMTQAALTRFRGEITGFIFQQFNLLPALTAAENASIPLLIAGRPAGEATAAAVALLEQLDLAPHVNKLPSQLSGGQQQRVAIARALVHKPRLVLCDEPTAALDAAAGLAVMRLLREVALAADRAVIVVTHDDRILPYADRIAHMADGRILGVDTNTPKEVALPKEPA